MADEDPPTFDDPTAEARYYRLQARDLQDELEELKIALSDFQSSSKELEDEMERELATNERRETELRTEAERLRGEVESWKTRHSSSLKDHSTTLAHMQKELEGLRASEKQLRAKLRDMELDNDDLEKNERAISSTLEDVESRYNKAVERHALLEQELVDKAKLEEELQRMRDELRDTAEEMVFIKTQRDEAFANAARSAASAEAPVAAAGPSTPKRGACASETELAPPDNDSADGYESAHRDSPQLAFIRPTPAKPAVASIPFTPEEDDASPGLLLTRPRRDLDGRPASPSLNVSTSSLNNSALARSTHVRNLATLASRKSLTPKAVPPRLVPGTGAAKKSESIISDMKDMTSRMEGMTQRLNRRRESLVAGSAIPRATPRARVSSIYGRTAEQSGSPTPPVPPLLPRSNSSTGSLGRTASVRRGMVTSPSAMTFTALGKQSISSAAASKDAEFRPPSVPIPARPSSRLAQQRPSVGADPHQGRASARPPSRLSSTVSRPVTPGGTNVNGGRPPTPSSQYGALASSSSRAPIARRVSMGPPAAGAAGPRPSSATGAAASAREAAAPTTPGRVRVRKPSIAGTAEGRSPAAARPGWR